jgi:ribosomal protein L9
MEVILLQDVDKLARRARSRPSPTANARNYLFPRQAGRDATAARIANVRKLMEDKQAAERREAERADETRDMLSKTVLTIPASVGSADRLLDR